MTAGRLPLVSFILVNYSDRSHLEACLEAIPRSSPSFSGEVIVVDNASTDGSSEFLAARFPDVRLIRNESNVGFARANNQAVRESRGDFILFLNTDTVIEPNAVDVLLATIGNAPEVGAAGPALVHAPGRFQVSFGRRVDFAAQLVQKYVLNPYQKVRLRRATLPRPAGWLSAACLLSRRSAFDQAGGFDERFFIYFEDIDLCVRMRESGWRLLYVPAARVFHEGGATTSPLRAASRLEYRRSQIYFYEKHNSRVSRRLLRAYLRLNLAVLRAAGRFRGEEGRALGKAYRDLLKRRGGKP